MTVWSIVIVVAYCISCELIKAQTDFTANSLEKRCPLTGLPGYIPHETDCSLFYSCQNGKVIVKKCPADLHFNSRKAICDYPENAGCSEKKGDTFYPKGKIADEFDQFPCPSEDDPRYEVLFSHPTDCSKYYSCRHGIAHVKDCSLGLHFSYLQQRCDYPQNVDCDKDSLNKPKGKSGRETRIDECPPRNSRIPKLLPHETDCDKFYICDAGVPHLKICHPGLHFSQKLQVCDYPEKAGCDATAVTDVTEDKKGKENTKNKCPSETSGHPVLLPHTSDCGKFYICSASIPHLKSCQQGLHFNEKLQICDYPSKAGCNLNFIRKPREKVIEDETMECPTNPSAGPHFIPDPQDCSKFFVCHHGRPHPQSCPSGLHFNFEIRSCDYPENAKCHEREMFHMTQQNAPGVPSPFCPSVDGKSLVFYLHPFNCSIYYMCSHGLAFEFSCPARLHFNLQKKVCDYEWLAGCEKDD